jgi:hypothetical protein
MPEELRVFGVAQAERFDARMTLKLFLFVLFVCGGFGCWRWLDKSAMAAQRQLNRKLYEYDQRRPNWFADNF